MSLCGYVPASDNVQRLEEAGVHGGLILHGRVVGEEGRVEQVFEAHDAMPDHGALRGLEVLGHAEDIHLEQAAVWGASAHDAGEVHGEGRLAHLRSDALVDLRGDEVLAAAQHERGDSVRVSDQGGGGRDGGNHEGRGIGVPRPSVLSNACLCPVGRTWGQAQHAGGDYNIFLIL